MAAIFQMTSLNAFFNENVCISIKILLKLVPNGPVNNIPALDNGLALSWWLAFIWTGDGIVSWCIYASIDLNELIKIDFIPVWINNYQCGLKLIHFMGVIVYPCWDLS